MLFFKASTDVCTSMNYGTVCFIRGLWKKGTCAEYIVFGMNILIYRILYYLYFI